MNGMIAFVGFGVLVLAAVSWTIMKAARQGNERQDFLKNKGFVPCNEEKADLESKVTSLERNADYHYSVKQPFKASFNGTAVYFYQKNRRRTNRRHIVDEFLIPFKRRTNQSFMLYLKPSSLGQGMGINLLRSLTSISWDVQPDGLVKIDLPLDLQNNNILAALAPEGTSLYDLLDSHQLSLVLQGGNYGIITLRCNNDICSIEYLPKLPGADLNRLWSFIQQMLSCS
jgi:hypothetical protein